jgi:xylan 1,4-beta-xylosidase
MTLDRRAFIGGGAALAGVAATGSLRAADLPVVPVMIDTRAATGALAHVWEECAGSDRAAITLRESWRHDLDRWTHEIGLKRVRFHGIFNDELGVYTPMVVNRYRPAPNFQNVFAVYDGLVARGVAPYVELSFMPKALASGEQNFGFYKGNISPPANNDAWAAFISLFVKALIGRYGLAIVRTWMFEVWNEPDLRAFWAGTQQQYFDMYKATAVAIKAIDPQLQVGGPSTSRTNWIPEFAAWTAANNAPVDFFATHCYASDNQGLLFGAGTKMPQADVIPAAVKKARLGIEASPHKGKPMWLSEWSSDSPAMIAHIIKGCLPHLQAMSHWVMSGTYEELGVFPDVLGDGKPSYANLIQGIALPGFNAYKMLHALGHIQLAADGPALASRRADGSLAALVWNLAEATQPSGIPGVMNTRDVKGETKRLLVHLKGARGGAMVKVQFVDQTRGSPFPAWRKMGSPQYPTVAQVAALRKAADIAPPVTMRLSAAGTLALDLPPEGLALIRL